MRTTTLLTIFASAVMAVVAIKWQLGNHKDTTSAQPISPAVPESPSNAGDLLPERLKPLVGAFSARPPSALALLARAEDRAQLIAAYRATTDLAHRRGLTWALAYQGDAQVTPLFRGALTQSYARELSLAEEDVLCDTAVAIGFVAEQDTAGFEFLRGATAPEFWEATRKWTSTRGAHAVDMLVSCSIQGLGISGREAVPAILDELRGRDANYLHRFAGDVVQAAYYLHLRTTRGVEFLKQNLVRKSKDETVFGDWSQGPGKPLYDWANDCMRGPRPTKAGR